MATTDPTFYRSPGAAVAAAPEQLAYVAAFDPAGQVRDALAVVDCDSDSATYGRVVGWAELPTAGNELHHFGWNACSSALCHEGHEAHHGQPLERRYLLQNYYFVSLASHCSTRTVPGLLARRRSTADGRGERR